MANNRWMSNDVTSAAQWGLVESRHEMRSLLVVATVRFSCLFLSICSYIPQVASPTVPEFLIEVSPCSTSSNFNRFNPPTPPPSATPSAARRWKQHWPCGSHHPRGKASRFLRNGPHQGWEISTADGRRMETKTSTKAARGLKKHQRYCFTNIL